MGVVIEPKTDDLVGIWDRWTNGKVVQAVSTSCARSEELSGRRGCRLECIGPRFKKAPGLAAATRELHTTSGNRNHRSVLAEASSPTTMVDVTDQVHIAILWESQYPARILTAAVKVRLSWASVWAKPVNLGLSIHHHAIRHPDRPAVLADGFRRTYRELDAISNRMANMLRGRYGVGRGMRVAYLMPNRPEIPELLAGILKLGAIAVPMNFRLELSDLAALCDNASPHVMVTDSATAERARSVAQPRGISLVVIDEDEARRDLERSSAAFSAEFASIPSSDDACIVYTSGTTGLPKGAAFTHGAIMNHAANFALECEVDGASRYLISLPHHVSVTVGFAPCFYVGATTVMTEVRSFDGDRFLRTVRDHSVTHTEIVPTQLYRVLASSRSQAASIPSIRTIAYGSAPAAPDRIAEIIERFGPVFMQLYGMTEIAGIGTTLRKHEHVEALKGDRSRLSSAGQASYGVHVRVVSEAGEDVASGERGEVWFRSPSIMRCYWQNTEQTAATIVDGCVRSGDIGEMRDGFLYLVDRKKDLIIRGGQNLSSKEIEEVLFRHPAVFEVAVVGAPDAEWGEQAVAVIVPRGEPVSADELRAFCTESGLSRFKTPTRFEFIDSLPKNGSGKVAKAELRERYRSEAGPAPIVGR